MTTGVKCWSFSSSQYIQNAVKNIEAYLSKAGEKPLHKTKSPWPCNYRPETDISPELTQLQASYFQSLIEILQWIVELRQANICMKTSAMASMMAMPQQGHLNTLFHMFAFLKNKHNGVMVFDPTLPTINKSAFPEQDWSATAYSGCKEDIPPNAPKPQGIGFTMRAFVDSDHAGDTATQRSQTVYIIFFNGAQIYWFSKKQTCADTLSFGLEFIAIQFQELAG